MDHTFHAEVEKIKEFLDRCYIKHNYDHSSAVALNADVVWDAARFWAFILYKGNSVSITGSLEEYLMFKSDYETTTGSQIEDKSLFERHWLRKVLGFIEIPGTISFANFTFKDIEPFQEELKFLFTFQPSSEFDSPTYDKAVVEAARKDYEISQGVTLSNKGLYESRWARIKDGKVSMSNLEVYFKQYKDNWELFKFLSAYIAKSDESRKEVLSISIDVFDRYYQNFKVLFSEIPAIDEFLSDNVLNKTETAYTIKFDNNNIYWYTLKNKISGFLWELLVKDVSIVSDIERLRIWLVKTGYWEYIGDPLKDITTVSKESFLTSAYELVVNEKDLEGVDIEMVKVMLDGTNSKGTIHELRPDFIRLKNEDVFELLESINLFEDGASTTYLHDQRSRHYLGILIKLLVKNDFNYEKISGMLKEGINKPYLLWETKQFVLMDRLDAIPVLLVDQELSSMAFILIDEIRFPDEEKDFLSAEIWKKSIKLCLKVITSQYVLDKAVAGKKIFQIYRQLNHDKYQLPYNRDGEKHNASQKVKKNKEDLVLKLIENCPLYQGPNYNSRKDHYLLPEIFDELALLFVGYVGQSKYRNGTIQFPMLKWDGLIWLMKVSTFYQYGDQLKLKPVNIAVIVDEFVNGYLGVIEIKEIAKYDYKEKKDKLGLPLWSEKLERLDNLDWLYPIYLIFKEGKLDKFLSPIFDIIPTDDIYLDKNKFTADKIRTHIGVLMQVLKKLILPEIPFGFEKKDVNEIKSRIEAKITEYLIIHTSHSPKEGKLDLFDFNREIYFNSGGAEALLPQIARAINWFTQKDLIIDAIIQSGNITKILTIADFITSEGIRKQLLDKIKKADILAFLEDLNWIPEVQNTLIKISQYPELVTQIEEAMVYWEIEIAEKRNDFKYHNQLFQTKLLLAYFKRSEKELDDVPPPPDKQLNDSRELTSGDYKQFYKALIRIGEFPESSYEIFEGLYKRFPNYPSLALNRLVAKYNLADKEDSTVQLNIALQEWDAAEKAMSVTEIDSLEPNIATMKLKTLYKLNNDTEIDNLFDGLGITDKMLPDILTIKIGSLIRRKRKDEANILIETAEKYHQFGDFADIEFVQQLRNEINQTDTIQELRINYGRIYQSKPDKLIQIFPENLNGKNNLKEFITQEFVYASDQMLDKIKSIEEIKDENKYNDLIELVIDSKIYPWGWRIASQSRGAFSGSLGIQPGERDLPVKDAGNKIIMVCEAFIYRGVTTAKSHLEKVFNYYHQRDVFLVLVYDTGEKGTDFDKNFADYMNNIIPKTNFNPVYELIPPVNDVTADFGMKNSAIKVVRSMHKTDVIIFHIFININYALQQTAI